MDQRPDGGARRLGAGVRSEQPRCARELGRQGVQRAVVARPGVHAAGNLEAANTYFIKQVAPVAEEAGVRIGIHPDDPPVPVLAGVPRCIFSNYEGYKRAMEIANSPNVGICLCCGTWLEGGKKLTGKDPEKMIRAFGARKIWKIHFRNVSAPLPHFVETFMARR